MKTTLLLLSSAICLLTSATAQTNVSGFISANTTWNLAGSPYVVVGNTLLSHGYTLTIDPGVVVKFNDSTALQIDGELHAIGTAANRITFTSNQTIPAAGDWAKVHFADTSVSATYDASGNYLSGCIMKYCDVLYGGQLGFGNIHVQSSSPYISQCYVKYSAVNGIYSAGSTYLLDSSLVSNNTGYGLYFDQLSQFSCGLLIIGDTIKNNTNGGLYLGMTIGTCTTEVRNNYFISNMTNGAINDNYTRSNVSIKNNYFLNNFSSTGGIVHFFANFTSFNNITIEENYFNLNNGRSMINIKDQSIYINIIKNYFINNISQGGIINNQYGMNYDTIRCNHFLNNQISGAVISMFNGAPINSGIITNNIFDGNINSVGNGVSVLDIWQANQILDFSFNTIRNNSTVNGTTCRINAYLNDSTGLLRIHHNDFSNNTANNIIYFDGTQINNGNLNFLYMKYNNFLDTPNNYELYNHIPYGSPNVQADNNYWGSTSTQYIDSMIYDYFDFANQSVVYYSPILTSPVVIDTSCTQGKPTSIENDIIINNINLTSTLFPNPFTTTATIKFSRSVHAATLRIYNMYGQLVAESSNINGESFRINAETFRSGVYVYEVTEKGKKIFGGKAVVY